MIPRNCQQKNYDIKLQIITELNIPIKSPINAAINTNLFFLIPILLVYIAIVYKVVSVDPIIVEAISPNLLSTPYFIIISLPIAIEALPDIGLNIAKGIISVGILKKLTIG